MRIGIVGAGPAGLYAAILLKRSRPDATIEIFDQNPPDATWGFGVVFSSKALSFLRASDPETADLIEPEMETWSDIAIVHRGETVTIDGIGFSAIGRLRMLQLFQDRASRLGITPHFNTRLESLEVFADADLVIAADGLNSVVRAEDPSAFGESITPLDNRFVWYGCERPFDALTQTFKQTTHGCMTAHHYRYAPDRSTFLIECEPKAFEQAGFEAMPEPERRAVLEQIFRQELRGSALVDNHSVWRQFPVLKNERWYNGNRVLVGDALHTAHFSIGSGTRLALEDVIALVQALEATDFDVSAALPAYQAERQPVLEKLTKAALASAHWYEKFGEHMALDPWPFALSYILRAQRLDSATLEKIAPEFSNGLRTRGLLEEAA
ncbi:MAG: FAD-dependent monooxygenase [Pseudomonadota bacterium]